MSSKFRFSLEESRSAFEQWFKENSRKTWSTSSAFKLPVVKDERRAVLKMTGKAWAKMLILIHSFDSEVAWHGTVQRNDDHPASFTITDILLYPQEVTGSTVTTNQEDYQNWMLSLDEDQLMSMRFQGHSHVNMGVTPSPTDVDHQEGIVGMMKNEDFYIFGIFNKKGDKTLRIFDCKTNVYYETKDIDFSVICDDIGELREDMDAMVTKKTYTYAGVQTTGFWNGGTATTAKTTATPAKTATITEVKVVTPTPKSASTAASKKADAPKKGKRETEYEYPNGWGYDDYY